MRYMLFLSCLFTLGVHAEKTQDIYRYTDDNGRTVYSDKAPKGSSPVSLPRINTAPAIEPHKPKPPPSKTTTADINGIHISSPSNGAIIPNGLVPTTVTTRTDRTLSEGQQIRISLDDRAVGTTTSTTMQIPNIPRGQHQISAAVINKQGKIIAESAIKVMVYRPSH